MRVGARNRKQVTSIYELNADEQMAVWSLVAEVRATAAHQPQADAFNIGVNDGIAAGQTVEHAHVDVNPRRNGDVSDPRGGIRWIIDDKANYWDK
jgi:diadenosine tetraphosphate (Ap4A) HIT family hydrolase